MSHLTGDISHNLWKISKVSKIISKIRGPAHNGPCMDMVKTSKAIPCMRLYR
jgi:hypothetical protein